MGSDSIASTLVLSAIATSHYNVFADYLNRGSNLHGCETIFRPCQIIHIRLQLIELLERREVLYSALAIRVRTIKNVCCRDMKFGFKLLSVLKERYWPI